MSEYCVREPPQHTRQLDKAAVIDIRCIIVVQTPSKQKKWRFFLDFFFRRRPKPPKTKLKADLRRDRRRRRRRRRPKSHTQNTGISSSSSSSISSSSSRNLSPWYGGRRASFLVCSVCVCCVRCPVNATNKKNSAQRVCAQLARGQSAVLLFSLSHCTGAHARNAARAHAYIQRPRRGQPTFGLRLSDNRTKPHTHTHNLKHTHPHTTTHQIQQTNTRPFLSLCLCVSLSISLSIATRRNT
jgi:hypothetical protein